MIYFWLIVRSAYLDLKEAKTPALPVYVDHDKIEDEKIEKAGGKYLKIWMESLDYFSEEHYF